MNKVGGLNVNEKSYKHTSKEFCDLAIQRDKQRDNATEAKRLYIAVAIDKKRK